MGFHFFGHAKLYVDIYLCTKIVRLDSKYACQIENIFIRQKTESLDRKYFHQIETRIVRQKLELLDIKQTHQIEKGLIRQKKDSLDRKKDSLDRKYIHQIKLTHWIENRIIRQKIDSVDRKQTHQIENTLNSQKKDIEINRGKFFFFFSIYNINNSLTLLIDFSQNIHIKFTTFFTKYLQYKNFCSLSALIDRPKTIINCTTLLSLHSIYGYKFYMHREWNKEDGKRGNIRQYLCSQPSKILLK